MIPIIKKNNTIANTHITGNKTHNHDHVMLPANLRPISSDVTNGNANNGKNFIMLSSLLRLKQVPIRCISP
jgi:hypothetical protein